MSDTTNNSAHTPGRAVILLPSNGGGKNENCYAVGTIGQGYNICTMYSANTRQAADARLIADAFNVANETGLTPRQLQQQRAALLNALDRIIDRASCAPNDDPDKANAEFLRIMALAQAARDAATWSLA